jgi:nucleotide-binding universal stress UspA family protein
MYQRILVALDGSESSTLAMDHAIQLAKDQRAQLRLVHVIDPSVYMTAAGGGYPVDMTPMIEGLRQAGRQALADAEAKARGAEVQSESELLESGDPSERNRNHYRRGCQALARRSDRIRYARTPRFQSHRARQRC